MSSLAACFVSCVGPSRACGAYYSLARSILRSLHAFSLSPCLIWQKKQHCSFDEARLILVKKRMIEAGIDPETGVCALIIATVPGLLVLSAS